MENEMTFLEKLEPLFPYISSIVCSLIAGFASYFKARKDSKEDMAKLEKQHELDIDKQRQKFAMEKEKLELEHKHQLEMMQAQFGNQVGTDIISTFAKEYVRSPAGQAQFRAASQKKRK